MWSIPWFWHSIFCTCPEIQRFPKNTLEYPWQCAIQVQPTPIPPHIPHRWAGILHRSHGIAPSSAQSTALGMQGGEPGNAVYLQVSRSTLSCPAQLHRASPGKICPPQGRRNVQFCSELSAHEVVGKQLQQFPGFQSLVSGCSHEALSVLGCVQEQGYGFKQNIINY